MRLVAQGPVGEQVLRTQAESVPVKCNLEFLAVSCGIDSGFPEGVTMWREACSVICVFIGIFLSTFAGTFFPCCLFLGRGRFCVGTDFLRVDFCESTGLLRVSFIEQAQDVFGFVLRDDAVVPPVEYIGLVK